MQPAIPHTTDRDDATPQGAAAPRQASLLGWAEFFQRLGDDARLPLPEQTAG